MRGKPGRQLAHTVWCERWNKCEHVLLYMRIAEDLRERCVQGTRNGEWGPGT